MTRHLVLLLLVLLVPALGVAVTAQTPLFKSSVTTVVVDVSVRRNGEAVEGLIAEDFRLTDNGVPQTVSQATRETLPVDITYVADISGSVEGPLLDSLRRAIEIVRGQLRPGDRASLVVFDDRIREVSGLERRGIEIVTEGSGPGGGAAALLDAAAVSLIKPVDPAQRRMAILFTDGQDFGSFIDESELVDVAARSGTTIFVVAVTDGTTRVRQAPANARLLTALTEATGGAVAVVQRDGDVGASFVRALEEFRTSYVLRYTPAGDVGTGWHALEVGLTRRGRFDIRARKGYFDDAVRPGG